MEPPLWTEEHAPSLADIPQEQAREHLQRAVEEPMNLIVHGPKGSGKTAGVRALAEATHENPDADLIEINVADVFDMTKSQIRDDPRFGHFLEGETEFSKQYRTGSKENEYKREWSKREMLSHILQEMAGYAPTSGEYKTILLDNAEGMREDFQQALRRVMEQYYEATQFVIATRQPSALIAPIRSRCFPVVMRAPTHAETVGALERIVEREGVDYDDDGLEYVAGYADGDLRAATLGAQTTYEQQGEITMNAAYEALNDVEADDQVETMVEAAAAGEFTDARSTLDDLLVDEGHSGVDVLEDVLAVVRSKYSGDVVAEIHRFAGEIDADLVEGTNDRLHVSHLLAELGEIVET
ncbi:AAA family ATPase [Halomicrobium salinisoli]|uniref:AAA family ATPase n=1 Tax=Halomicrobium salinisoli TaxID=2878391 RepID=UPI001CF0266C|nr:AAA family ATPase [Halomicrobium salinisoli]